MSGLVMEPSKIILGIDPGFGTTGYAILKKDQNKATLLDYGYLSLPTQKHLSERIGIFYNFFNSKISELKITQLAIETPFLGKNVQTFLKLGYLRGALYLLADQHNINLFEFSPREVKAAVTGFGGASKDQVASMILRFFPKINQVKATAKSDVTDALAVCLTGFWMSERKKLLAAVPDMSDKSKLIQKAVPEPKS
ncbi:MAG: crossover junction endodeoxyribonuclease RuvC [bacterium]